MGIFNRRPERTELVQETDRIEVVRHKDATQQAMQNTREANNKLKDLLVENGFTIKIYLAAGGKTKKSEA